MAVTHQPEKSQLLIRVDGNRDFTTGLFDCFEDLGSCVCMYFCMPCVVCRLANRLHECPLMPYFVYGGILAMRTKIRAVGGIKGSICCDCITIAFCAPCAVCQMSREMDAMGL